MNRSAPQPADALSGARSPWDDAADTLTASARPRGGPVAGERPTRSRFALGVLAGLAVMAVASVGYGGLLRATMSGGGVYHEFTFAALAVGLAVGAATGLAGGRNAALPVVGLLLAVLGVLLGEMVGLALISSHRNGMAISDVVFGHYATLFDDWRRQVDVMSCVFLLLAGVEGFIVTRRFGDRSDR